LDLAIHLRGTPLRDWSAPVLEKSSIELGIRRFCVKIRVLWVQGRVEHLVARGAKVALAAAPRLEEGLEKVACRASQHVRPCPVAFPSHDILVSAPSFQIRRASRVCLHIWKVCAGALRENLKDKGCANDSLAKQLRHICKYLSHPAEAHPDLQGWLLFLYTHAGEL